MLFRDLNDVLNQNGYFEMSLNNRYIHMYEKQLEDWKEYILVIEYEWCDRNTVEESKILIEHMQNRVKQKNIWSELTTILITRNANRYRDLMSMRRQPWILDVSELILLVYESEERTNLVLQQQIEKLLSGEFVQEGNQVRGNSLQVLRSKLAQIPVCTVALIAINVLVYLILRIACSSYQGYDAVVDSFGTQVEAIFERHEYYRLITATFLHGGITHLLNNMIWLFFLGRILEERLKPIRFLSLYLLTGLFADGASLLYNMFNHREAVVSIGASGAVFGLVGAMLYIVIANKGNVAGVTITQMALCVIFSLYGGFTADNIDNAAHIGGFIAGFLLAILFIHRDKYRSGGKS